MADDLNLHNALSIRPPASWVCQRVLGIVCGDVTSAAAASASASAPPRPLQSPNCRVLAVAEDFSLRNALSIRLPASCACHRALLSAESRDQNATCEVAAIVPRVLGSVYIGTCSL